MITPDQPCFLRLPARLIPLVTQYLENNEEHSAAREVREFTRHYLEPELDLIRSAWVKWAQESKQKDGEIEFDSDATISVSESGKGEYVLGWVWVEAEDSNEDE